MIQKNSKEKCKRCGGTGKVEETNLNPAYVAIFGFPIPTIDRVTCPECHGSGTK